MNFQKNVFDCIKIYNHLIFINLYSNQDAK